jgi:hypothetical protein
MILCYRALTSVGQESCLPEHSFSLETTDSLRDSHRMHAVQIHRKMIRVSDCQVYYHRNWSYGPLLSAMVARVAPFLRLDSPSFFIGIQIGRIQGRGRCWLRPHVVRVTCTSCEMSYLDLVALQPMSRTIEFSF